MELNAKAFVSRDWARVDAAKRRYWASRPLGTAGHALELADALRQEVRSLRPDWPNEAEREDDLRHHIKVSKALSSVR
jgi:hypothetical protein